VWVLLFMNNVIKAVCTILNCLLSYGTIKENAEALYRLYGSKYTAVYMCLLLTSYLHTYIDLHTRVGLVQRHDADADPTALPRLCLPPTHNREPYDIP